MSGARAGLARVVGLGVCLALALLLLAAREANAARYSVAQCGWHVGADAGWWDSTGGTKFRPDAYCATPPGSHPFEGAHLKTFTRGGTVSGTRFARWRWTAPPGTGITRVSGTWWHTLHDGMEQRLGAVGWNGEFVPFAGANGTDVTPRGFAASFGSWAPAIEDRLLCARAESKFCGLEPGSWSAVRTLTLTLDDIVGPSAWIGGELGAGGWRRGQQGIAFSGNDTGAGVRYGETLLDGHRVGLVEYPCDVVQVDGELRGARMQPCLSTVSGNGSVDTAHFSDANHILRHCVTDFAGNAACTPGQTVGIDNNVPAQPRNVSIAGGGGWRPVNNFDLTWTNPDQRAASPIWGAFWRVSSAAGFDTGIRFAGGRDVASLADVTVPGPGVYWLELWLRDEAGNESRGNAVTLPLLLDNVAPQIAFEPVATQVSDDLPDLVRASVHDAHSGPVQGDISYRRLGREEWVELPTKLVAGSTAGAAQLVAALPRSLDVGTYAFRAEVRDAAGNSTSTTRRADGIEMSLRKVPPPPSAVAPAAPVGRVEPAAAGRTEAGRTAAALAPAAKRKTRLFAHLRWEGRRGESVTVPFAARARIVGRLVTAAGAGLAGHQVRVVARPSRGALAPTEQDLVESGPHGGFRLDLPSGTSRRITVSFAGDRELGRSRRAALALRVRGALSLHASPPRLETGESIRLWGGVRARGAPLPRRGKLVAIQYFEREARRWRPVLVVRSDQHGRFRARYRFRYVSGVARIELRAVALAEERWPYAPGASPPVRVRVSGR
jgi:hypothetical protein